MPLKMTAAELTQQTNQVHIVYPLITYLFFGDIKTTSDTVVKASVTKGGKQVAPYVSPRLGGKVMKKQGGRVSFFSPPLMKPKYITEADDLLVQDNIFRGDGKEPEDRALEKLEKDETELKKMVARQKEVQAVTVATEGKLTVKGDGVEDDFDYGQDSSHQVTLVGSAKWSDASAKPFEDIDDGQKAIWDATGKFADVMVMGLDAQHAFEANPNVKAEFETNEIDNGTLSPAPLLDEEGKPIGGILYLGFQKRRRLHIYSYNEQYEIDDVSINVFPKNKVLLGASNIGGHFSHAGIADRKELPGEIFEGEIFVKSYVENDPADEYLVAQSKGLAIPGDVDAFYTMEVVD